MCIGLAAVGAQDDPCSVEIVQIQASLDYLLDVGISCGEIFNILEPYAVKLSEAGFPIPIVDCDCSNLSAVLDYLMFEIAEYGACADVYGIFYDLLSELETYYEKWNCTVHNIHFRTFENGLINYYWIFFANACV